MMENAHNDGNRYQPAFKTAFRNSVPHHKEVHWFHHRCYIAEHKSLQYEQRTNSEQ